jgi:hypothetical protein
MFHIKSHFVSLICTHQRLYYHHLYFCYYFYIGSQVWTVDDVKHDLELILSKDVNFTFDFPFIDEARNEADRIQREKESKIASSP